MKTWQSTLLGASYIAAGGLFILSLLQFAPEGPITHAVIASGIGILILVLAHRFLPKSEPSSGGNPLLMVCWAAAGAAILYGVTQVTPAGPPRQFVAFAGLGSLIAFLGWRFLASHSFSSAPPPDASKDQQERDTRNTSDLLLSFSYVGGFGVLLYSIHAVVPAGQVDDLFRYVGAGLLIACASLIAGALLGFLFGIPRAPASQPNTPAQLPANDAGNPAASQGSKQPTFGVNTNLQDISDWLTKIIVGLGLINLKKVPVYLGNLASYFGASFGDKVPGRDSVALAIIVLFSVCGFLLGYLLTRLFLTKAFERAASSEVQSIVTAAGQVPLLPPGDSGPRPASVDPGQIAAAQRLSQVATEADIAPLQRQVYGLAEEYNTQRKNMLFSPERTRILDSVVAKMRVLHGPTYGLLANLSNGKSAGERLAAIAFLEMRPNPDYLNWLADRFEVEAQPFLWYHAALALRAGAETLNEDYRPAIRTAIQKAQSKLQAAETDTRSILEAAAKAVQED